MPQAIASLIVTAIGATGVAATVLTGVIALGITAGLSALVRSLFGQGRPKPSDGQQVVREAAGSRFRHYGIVHTGGQLAFLESRNGRLAQVVTLGTGEESEILEHRINDRPVTVAGGTVTEASYRGAIRIYTRPGADDQAAIGELTAAFPEWTADHRQRGCAHAAILADPVKQEHFSEVFNGQMPQYSQVRKAAKIYDPRKDSTAGGAGAHRLADKATWEWSDNAALVIADYMAHPDGYGLGYDNIAWANIAAEADVADEMVDTVSGGPIARWRLWVRYGLVRDERRQVLTDMLKAVDGFCWQDAAGRFALKLGGWTEPSVVITDDHILSMRPSMGPQAQDRASAIKALYTEAAIGYREQESATVSDPGAEGPGGVDPNTDPQSVQLYYAPHHNQAVRVAKLIYRRLGDERWHIPMQLNLFGLSLIGERFCRVESEQLGVAGWFMVEGLTFDFDRMSVGVQLSEVSPDDWAFDAAIEEGTPPASSAGTPGVAVIAVPTGLALSAAPIALGGGSAVAIAASWDDPGRAGLVWQARYRPSAGGDWVMMTVDDDARTARSGPVDSGTEYAVQIRALAITGRASEWTASEIITPSAAIAAPTALAALGGTGEAEVRFSMPAAGAAYARLYAAASPVFGAAAQVGGNIVAAPGALVTITDTGLSAGDRHYWARAFGADDQPSAPAGPVTATIS